MDQHCGCISALAAGAAAHSHGCSDAAVRCSATLADGSTLQGNTRVATTGQQTTLSAQRRSVRRDLQWLQPPAQPLPCGYSPAAGRGGFAQHGSPQRAVDGVQIAALRLHPRIAVGSVGVPAAPGAGPGVPAASSPVLHAGLSASGSRPGTQEVQRPARRVAGAAATLAATVNGHCRPNALLNQ